MVVGAVVLALLAGTAAYLATRPSGTPAASHPAATTPSSGASAVPAGYLTANGTRIVDSSGNVVQLQGYNVTGMESTNPQGSDSRGGTCNAGWRPLTTAEVGQIAAYGFNSVRLPISWGNLEPTAPTSDGTGALTHRWNTAYVAALDSEIAQLGDARLKVILDMHQSSWSPAFSTPATAK
ncbi:MAG: cellulase family glycosylhydrolase, partial [Acidimicrobiales bacterium]